MKKLLLFLLPLIIAFSCAACSSDANDETLKLAKKAWKSVSLSTKPTDVFIMKYTRKGALCDKETDEFTTAYDALPYSGYMILFYSNESVSFNGLEACILSEGGQLLSNFNYRKNDEIFDTNLAAWERDYSNTEAYYTAIKAISNCNYFAGMKNYCRDHAVERPKGDLENNVWYSFSQSDINNILSN